MILAVDVGNTNTVVGLFDGKKLIKQWRMGSSVRAFSQIISKIPQSIKGVIVSSVVPRLDQPFRTLAKKKFGVTALFVSPHLKMPIRIKVKNPRQVGTDRIVNAVAAWTRWKQDLIVVDFGTATTFDVVTQKGNYLGGVITPGLGIINQALPEKTAKLPLVPLKRPQKTIGRSTIEAIQSGVFLGYASLVDGMIQRIKKEFGSKMKVVATGGLAVLMACECQLIDQVDPDLTLKGLQVLSAVKH